MFRKVICLVGAVLLAVAPLTTSAKDRPTDKFAALADAYIQKKVAEGVFSGSVLIAYDGLPLLRRAYGLANRELDVPARPDDTYQIASITKTFTAAAVATLVMDGRLSFDDPVGKYLPEAPEAWANITIAHLLSHESGLAEYSATTNSFRALMRIERSPQEILRLVEALPLSFEPGSRYRYTNTDFVLLGLIIERVSGKAYEAYLRDRLLEPIGLRRTGFVHAQELLPRRSSGYMKEDERWVSAFYIDPSNLYAAGSMYSTVDDLLLWDQALHSDRLFPSEMRQQLFRDRGHGYGLGFFVDAVAGHPFVGHGGSLPGVSTDFQRFQEAPLTVIFLSNSYRAPVEKMTRELGQLFLEHCAPRTQICNP